MSIWDLILFWHLEGSVHTLGTEIEEQGVGLGVIPDIQILCFLVATTRKVEANKLTGKVNIFEKNTKKLPNYK